MEEELLLTNNTFCIFPAITIARIISPGFLIWYISFVHFIFKAGTVLFYILISPPKSNGHVDRLLS